jgi:hypothetical protein
MIVPLLTALALAACLGAGAAFAQNGNGPGGTTSGSTMNDHNLDPSYRPRTGEDSAPPPESVSDRDTSGKQEPPILIYEPTPSYCPAGAAC